MASRKAKSIDDMNILEIAKTMEVLGVSWEGLETLSDMKSRLKTALSQAEKTPSWSAGQAFSILSEAKEEDTRLRQVLLEFYTEADKFVDKMDEQILTLLQKHTGNIKEKMGEHMKQLKQKEYFLLVAGETSSGKSSLVNLILGEEILPYSLLSLTSNICELKFGEERRLVAHYKDKDPETGLSTKTISLKQTAAGSSEQSYLQQISHYVHVKNYCEKDSVFKKIELFWPHSLLQKGIVIIDSPGVGESDEMDKMVSQYLPEAFAFIYVINSANAGGVQRDRLEKFLQEAWKVSFEVQKKEKDEGKLLQDLLLSKCALFVCNKWDQIPKNEIQIIKNHVTKKLERIWPGVDPESQIIYISTKTADTAQHYGLITGDFFSLMNGMRSVVLKSIEARLELHWRWLDDLLSRIIFQAKAFVVNASRDRNEVKQKVKRIGSPSVIEIISKFLDDHKSLIEYIYQPILDKGTQHRNHLAVFGITEVCAVKIRREELDWKEDESSRLGRGAFGAVYKGTMTKQGEVRPVALKVCSEELDVGNASEIMQEMKILRMLDHPHIVQFYGVSLLEQMDSVRMILVMEKCKGNLKSRIFKDPESAPGKSENPSVVEEVCRWAKEITDGLSYIHGLGVVHRDLKLENILLSEENFVKIADVGLAKPEEFITGTFTGTPLYMAPEVFHRQVYDTKADIYSLGIMLWEMWYGQRAFADVTGRGKQDLFDWVDKGNRPVERKGCKKPPLLWEQLMTQCWDGNPEKRPTAKECHNETSMLLVEFETSDKAIIG